MAIFYKVTYQLETLFMAFYESIIIIRQDVSSSDVDKIIDDLKQVSKAMMVT